MNADAAPSACSGSDLAEDSRAQFSRRTFYSRRICEARSLGPHRMELSMTTEWRTPGVKTCNCTADCQCSRDTPPTDGSRIAPGSPTANHMKPLTLHSAERNRNSDPLRQNGLSSRHPESFPVPGTHRQRTSPVPRAMADGSHHGIGDGANRKTNTRRPLAPERVNSSHIDMSDGTNQGYVYPDHDRPELLKTCQVTVYGSVIRGLHWLFRSLFGFTIPPPVHLWIEIRHCDDRWERFEVHRSPKEGSNDHLWTHLTHPGSDLYDVSPGEPYNNTSMEPSNKVCVLRYSCHEDKNKISADPCRCITSSKAKQYRARFLYRIYPGPNSNTFVRKFLDECGVKCSLPFSAYGATYSYSTANPLDYFSGPWHHDWSRRRTAEFERLRFRTPGTYHRHGEPPF